MGAPTSASADPAHICVCGHLATNHADPATGDTRRLAVEDRNDLLDLFDDARDAQHGCCACLSYVPASTSTANALDDQAELGEDWSGFTAGLRAVGEGRRVPRPEDFQ